jgi:hypothetical protein
MFTYNNGEYGFDWRQRESVCNHVYSEDLQAQYNRVRYRVLSVLGSASQGLVSPTLRLLRERTDAIREPAVFL